ncbi:MAG: PhoH family protein [Vicinamibacteria bacterium]|jgi:PhoH-like ATPase|nr:PhoH family protein [Vicinamibacteria bacterium]
MSKLFVVDTNVVLFDHSCIYNFQEHDVALSIVVLEELDRFKRGNEAINLEARSFIRELDELAGDRPLTEGLPLGEGRGRLFIEIGEGRSSRVTQAFASSKPDHRILALADELRERHPEREVILVSKDVNLRMKAKSLGLRAEDYTTGKVRHVDRLYSGTASIEGLPSDVIARLHAEPHQVPHAEVPGAPPKLLPNQYLVMKNGSLSALAHYARQTGMFERVAKRPAYGVEPRNAEQIFALDALMRPECQLVTLTGRAGTGKTLLALAAALEQRRHFRQIFLARPVVPMGNRDIGYLPGDVKSKLDPYMQPLWDNIAVIRHRLSPESREHRALGEMVEQEKICVAPLAYIRGRSLDHVYFIVDEAQNLTPHEVKTIITRAGEGSKVVFTGDIHQIDTPYLDSQSNGLTVLIDKMKDHDLFAHVNLVKGERSPLAELASNVL